MNTLQNKTILVVDDDADICEAVRSALEEAGGTVILAHSVDGAFETYRQGPPHERRLPGVGVTDDSNFGQTLAVTTTLDLFGVNGLEFLLKRPDTIAHLSAL